MGSFQAQNLQSQSQTQMPVALNPQINSKLSQMQPKKSSTSTFGLPKLTKLNSKPTETVETECKPQNVNQNSKIQTPGSLIGIKPQLKSPSIQLNSNSPLKIPLASKLTTSVKTPSKQITVTPIKRQLSMPSKSKLTFYNKTETNVARVQPFLENEKKITNEESDFEDEVLGIMDDFDEENVNEEEFQRFLNSDFEDDKFER